jgi:serine/threonine-protein kinase
VLGGKYRLVRPIGAGGMGTVWEAEHVEIGHKVAVKLMHLESTRDAERVARFRREAHVAGNLGHDNICNVLDIGMSEEHGLYLVMPLLRGRSLAKLLDEVGTLPTERALDITAQVLDALGAAHAAGIVHRDLKPDNVFVGRVGDRDDFVKVLDFGISKVSAVEGSAPLTQTGIVLGTPDYMAPEQARGRKDLDARVDLWAAGVMLYEMLSGKRPFAGDSVNEIIVNIVTEDFTPLGKLRPETPTPVDAIVTRALARDREERFADAASMRAAVFAALAAVAKTPAVSVPVQAVEPVRPARGSGASAAASVATPFASEVMRPSDPDAAPARGGAARWIFAFGALLAVSTLAGFLLTTRPRSAPVVAPPPAPAPALAPYVQPMLPPAPPTGRAASSPVAPVPAPPSATLPGAGTTAATTATPTPAKRHTKTTRRGARTKVITLPDGTTFETSNDQ